MSERMVAIDVDLAVDLAWHLAHPEAGDADPQAAREDRAAMYQSLVRYINDSGQWHLTIPEDWADGRQG